MGIEKTIANTTYISKGLDLLARILESGSCENCADRKTCKYAPADGELPRYNCPHYRSVKMENPCKSCTLSANEKAACCGCPDGLNGRLTQQAETIEDLTMRLSEAEALLNIARGEGGS